MEKQVLVVGHGAREHAICWKLDQSEQVSKIFVLPGNSGTSLMERVKNVDIPINNNKAVVTWCQTNKIDMVVIGPEVPLANGISNAFSRTGILCFGPSAEAAKIESDKQWSKYFMDKYNIPTARWKSFVNQEDAKLFIQSNLQMKPFVIKASGLAEGKGVIVASNQAEAYKAVDDMIVSHKFGRAGHTVIVEELLEGDEVSVLGFSDGKTIHQMLPVQDHKRLLNGDSGPNTGGMGAYCPYSLSQNDLDYIQHHILERAINGLNTENTPFIGILYAGLIMTKEGIKVLEFNCRFGDPEAQVLLPLLNEDLYKVFEACCTGTLDTMEINWHKDMCSVGIVLASKGYPESPKTNCVITGLDNVTNIKDCFVFHAGTVQKDKDTVTSGGRVLTVVCTDLLLTRASAKSLSISSKIIFENSQRRNDIAFKGIPRHILNYGQTTYKSSGVDVETANKFIVNVKEIIESTYRQGVLSMIGSFAAVVDMNYSQFKHPLLVSGSDGVGTKLKVAQSCNDHRTIGKDLVAMCVNDILAHGAEPLFFLDYFACGKLEPTIAEQVIEGIANACKEANCSLVGGETAEMPEFYQNNEYDLAGFVVGVVEKDNLIPLKEQMVEGDSVIYLPSNGFHSNGFSLVRQVLKSSGYTLDQVTPFGDGNTTFKEELLKPTNIYVNQVLPLINSNKIKGFAHITGGGLLENIPRILPPHLKVTLDATRWNIPKIFAWFAAIGNISAEEMLKTFNCGIGCVLIVGETYSKEVENSLNSSIIGYVNQNPIGTPQVTVTNFIDVLGQLMMPYVKPLIEQETKLLQRKKVAVLISGVGTNLKALIEAAHDAHFGAEIVVVVSSKEGVEGLNVAERHHIPTRVLNVTKYLMKEAYDKSLHTILAEFSVDFICLAGYMRILSGWFVKVWEGKILNIHPSLLPSFKGKDAQKQALDSGVRVTGCTVHFVEEEVDSGAIIEQAPVYIEIDDTLETLVEKIKMEEHKIFPKAVKLVVSGKIKLNTDTGKIERIK